MRIWILIILYSVKFFLMKNKEEIISEVELERNNNINNNNNNNLNKKKNIIDNKSEMHFALETTDSVSDDEEQLHLLSNNVDLSSDSTIEHYNDLNHHHSHDENFASVEIPQVEVLRGSRFHFSWRKLWAFMGPGFLVSVAYIDPGNFAVDMEAGAKFQYSLLWVLVFATGLGLILQVFCARLGVVTGRNLAQMCSVQYPKHIVYILWLIAESTVIASDIPEVLGTAIALKLLFNIKLWIGVLITSCSVMLFLALSYFGVRKVEFAICFMLSIIWICFLAELFMSDVDVGELLYGFVPNINSSMLFSAIAIIGAVVMPHNLFLHSALVQTRRISRDSASIAEANRYNFIESAIALLMSFIVNMAVVAISAASLTDKDDIGLSNAPLLLKRSLGHAAPALFAIALLSSGQSSTMTGTFAGQFVMEGFIHITIKPWLRATLTRSVAILPSLIVTLIATSHADSLIVWSQVLLSIQLPFSLIPLLKFTSSEILMGEFANTKKIKLFTYLLGGIVIVANLGLAISSTLPFTKANGAMKYILWIIILPLSICYIALIIYLLWKPVKSIRLLHRTKTPTKIIMPKQNFESFDE